MSEINVDHPMVFKPLRVAVAGPRLGSHTAASFQMEADDARNKLIAYVLARQLVGDKQYLEVAHPATWCQHLKLSLPGWVRKRWPVRRCTTRSWVSFAKYDAYPGADVPIPEQFGLPVQYDMVRFGDISSDQSCDAACAAHVSSTDVNGGRQFLSSRDLAAQLSHLVDSSLAGKTRYPDLLGGKNPTPRVVVQETLTVLERLGINTGALVQLYAIDDAHRTW